MNFLKKLIESILRFLRIAPEKERLIRLNANAELNFDADTNEVISDVCAVFASYERDTERAVNALVRFEVVTGPFVFQSNNRNVIEVRTDGEGRAAVDGHFTNKGFAVLIAELVEDNKSSVFFRGHSEGVTDQIFIYTEPCISADPGDVIAKIVALDRYGIPVTGAKIHFEGLYSGDQVFEGTVKETGNGEYEGTFHSHIAGSYEILAKDMQTHVTTYRHIAILPAAPDKFKFIGDTDPRASQPYGELLLRAQLQDEFGNGLDSARINCQVNGQMLSPLTLYGQEARFPIRLAGYGNVDVKLNDAESLIEHKMTVDFASTWVQDPGLVLTESRFKTPIYWLPPIDRPVQEAMIELSFNPELVSFAGFESNPEGPMTSPGAEAGNDLISIPISSEISINAYDYPDGIHIGYINWDCLGEGDTCFNLIAIMSPATPGWEMCVTQKNREKNKKCLCVNIIYKPGDTAGRDAGITAAKQVETAISSGNVFPDGSGNVKVCCPVISVKTDLKKNTTELTAAQWRRINTAIGGDGKISGQTDAVAVDGIAAGYKPNCININMIPFSTNSGGLTDVGPPGNSAIDPDEVGKRSNLGAHEIGHALGAPADHSDAGGDPNNLMTPSPLRKGAKLTKAQCKKIWETIDNYPCV